MTSSGQEDSHSLDSDKKWSLKPLLHQAERSHSRMPGIRKIPLRAIAIISFIAFLNGVVWIAAAIVLVSRSVHSSTNARLTPHLTFSSIITRTLIEYKLLLPLKIDRALGLWHLQPSWLIHSV